MISTLDYTSCMDSCTDIHKIKRPSQDIKGADECIEALNPRNCQGKQCNQLILPMSLSQYNTIKNPLDSGSFGILGWGSIDIYTQWNVAQGNLSSNYESILLLADEFEMMAGDIEAIPGGGFQFTFQKTDEHPRFRRNTAYQMINERIELRFTLTSTLEESALITRNIELIDQLKKKGLYSGIYPSFCFNQQIDFGEEGLNCGGTHQFCPQRFCQGWKDWKPCIKPTKGCGMSYQQRECHDSLYQTHCPGSNVQNCLYSHCPPTRNPTTAAPTREPETDWTWLIVAGSVVAFLFVLTQFAGGKKKSKLYSGSKVPFPDQVSLPSRFRPRGMQGRKGY